MAGGNLDTAVDVEMKGGEIDFLGADEADVDDVDAGVHQAFGQRLLERLTGQAHIAAHHDAAGFEEFAISAANAACDIFVEFITQPAPDVIGLEAGEFH